MLTTQWLIKPKYRCIGTFTYRCGGSTRLDSVSRLTPMQSIRAPRPSNITLFMTQESSYLLLFKAYNEELR
jgi:hypothetical protein